MASEHSTIDRTIKDHQAWLGFLQPEGLVVSPAALVACQCILRTGSEVATIQKHYEPFLKDFENPATGEQARVILDLRALLVDFLGWPAARLIDQSSPAATDAPRFDDLIVNLADIGETLEPSFALVAPPARPGPAPAKPAASSAKEAEPASPWMMLFKELPPGTSLDDATTGDQAAWSSSHSRRFERLLRETKVPLGIFSNGTHLRLMYAPRGENSGSLTFPVAAMAEVGGRPILSAFEDLLHARRSTGPSEARLPALLRKSRDFQASVSTELAQQVIDAAFELLRGLQAADERRRGDLLRDTLATNPAKVYEGLLTVLMRCVFILYAEDRGLMPGGELYLNNYSLQGLFKRLQADSEQHVDTMDSRFGAWAQLLVLFRLIHGGSRHPKLNLPARAGYLFDPDRFPFLEGRSGAEAEQHLPLIPDGTIHRVLRKLLVLNGERLSYRTLDVEQIGSVYEVMMGFGIGIAKGPSVAIKPKKTHGAPVPINLEELLAQSGGERAKWLKAATDQELTGDPATALKTAKSVDDLLVALQKRIARSATPSPVPKGAMLLVPSDERRRSGSNYTPRSLTEPIVRKTLEPILKRLGDDATPEQILDLKVCDPAMGSGAFLVEACRQLAESLVKAWHRHKATPTIPPDEDELLFAKRLVAQRCLYGVDKNPMAADLAKLSLWLATLARDHPFTFLDHSFRAGDALVGLTKAQIASFTWEPGGGLQKQIWAQLIEPRIDAALAARRDILGAGDFLNPQTKRQKLAVADEQLGLVRFIGDLAVAAFFAGEKDKQRKEKRQEFLQQLTAYLGDRSQTGSGGVTGDFTKRPQKPVDALKAGEKGVTPFHWEIEFPEVFGRNSPGFDAIVGNPPFLGGKRISGSIGKAFAQWICDLHEGTNGNVDLVAHFFRRVFMLVRHGGKYGLIATNTIAQGDTRRGGLRWLCENGATIYCALKRMTWPGDAAVVVSEVFLSKHDDAIASILDEKPVPKITAYLFHAGGHSDPAVLRPNVGRSFIGCDLKGQGFLFDDSDESASPVERMHELIRGDRENQSRIRPYMGGEALNADPGEQIRRWVIWFGEMGLEEAEQWPALLAIVRAKIPPERAEMSADVAAWPWWRAWRSRREFFEASRSLRRVLAASQISSHITPSFIPSEVIPSHGVNLFCFDTCAPFCVLQSRPHEVWGRFFGSSMKDDLRYTPSDCFETFPFPDGFETDPLLEAAGKAYHEFRAALMVLNNEGLTKTYNRFHDPEETSPDILKLRDLHAAMDRAVLDTYDWTDIPTACEFLLDYEEDDDDDAATETGKGRKKRKPYRYRWPDAVRDEVLARLLKLNAERAEAERQAGAASSPEPRKSKATKKTSTGKKAAQKDDPQLDFQ
jgi:hypothetical protein